ncbi:MAG: hypothetical protein DME44_04445 [Verrucomicrobia bacterium]|nr:MAG: hypothetical protein DME44_04445 [Verrucomicrobiota bacterium]
MNPPPELTEERITRLHGQGMVDLHFDLPMFLYDNRARKNVLASDFLPELEAGDIGTLAAGIYIEDQYVPDKALEVALGQIARIYVEVERCDRFAICRSFGEIKRAREQGKIALLIAMEGAEPLGTDLNLLRIFYELGLRVIGLTHARSKRADRLRLRAGPGMRTARPDSRSCAHQSSGLRRHFGKHRRARDRFAHQRAQILRYRTQRQRRAN